MLPHESEAQAEIGVTYQPYIDRMAALHDAVVGMMTVDTWTIRNRPDNTPFVVDIMRGLLTKALKTSRAIQILCERGLGEDANALLRVLLETTMPALYILKSNSQQRAQIYFAYTLNQQLKMFNDWRKTKGFKRRVTKKQIEALKAAIADVTKTLPPGTDYKRHWSGSGSLEEAIKSLKADSLYSVVYRHLSAVAHASDVGLHFETDADGELIWQLTPRVDGIVGPSFMARELLWILATSIDKTLGLGFKDALAPHRVTGPEQVEAQALVAQNRKGLLSGSAD
jgi:hypothetical protein